jgi:hypothetical protein
MTDGGVRRIALMGLGLVMVALVGITAVGATVEGYGRQVASLIDPGKLATLRARGANPRVQKYVALLAEAREGGIAPEKVAAQAVGLAAMKGDAAKLTAEAMVRNLTIAGRLGCLGAEGLQDMRRGAIAHDPTWALKGGPAD